MLALRRAARDRQPYVTVTRSHEKTIPSSKSIAPAEKGTGAARRGALPGRIHELRQRQDPADSAYLGTQGRFPQRPGSARAPERGPRAGALRRGPPQDSMCMHGAEGATATTGDGHHGATVTTGRGGGGCRSWPGRGRRRCRGACRPTCPCARRESTQCRSFCTAWVPRPRPAHRARPRGHHGRRRGGRAWRRGCGGTRAAST